MAEPDDRAATERRRRAAEPDDPGDGAQIAQAAWDASRVLG
uniref:Uncharacterized protein n=1 Tax=Arundo donax TaxID=35708 RepID=A0A0A9ARX5_ARUDO